VKRRLVATITDLVLLLAVMPLIIAVFSMGAITEIVFPLQPSNPPTKEEWRRGWV
jgi:hypothetical protein